MEDLDAALNELGMLSNVTSCRLEYLQASRVFKQGTRLDWFDLKHHLDIIRVLQVSLLGPHNYSC